MCVCVCVCVCVCIYIYIYRERETGRVRERRLTRILDDLTARSRNFKEEVPYFPAHKTHHDFFVGNFRKKIMMNVF